MAKLPVLPLYTDAFVADTLHLTPEEVGAYLLLLMAAWRTPDCTLPDNDQILARIARVSPQKWRLIKGQLRAFWESQPGGKLSQKRLSKEHSKALSNMRAQTANSHARKSFKNKNTDGSMDVPVDDPPIDPPTNRGKTTDASKGDPRTITPYPYPYPYEESGSVVPYGLAPTHKPAATAPQPEQSEKQLSSEAKLGRIDEIFAGSGAVIVNTSRFGDWERWGYDWALDVEPTLREIAARKGPEWSPRTLTFFDQPIAERYQARLAGAKPARPAGKNPLTDDEFDQLLADARTEHAAAVAKSMAEG